MPITEEQKDISKNFDWQSSQAPYSHSYLAPIIIKCLQDIKAGRVLDVGSGNGMLCADMKKAGMSVVGIEYNPDGTAISKSAYPDINFYTMGVQDNPDEIVALEGRFDAVISTEVIEHLFDPAELMSFSGKFLEKDGYLIISTPYHGYIKNLVLSILNKWDFHLHPWKLGGHIKFWSKKTLSDFIEECGYSCENFIGVGRFPYIWKSMIIVARKK